MHMLVANLLSGPFSGLFSGPFFNAIELPPWRLTEGFFLCGPEYNVGSFPESGSHATSIPLVRMNTYLARSPRPLNFRLHPFRNAGGRGRGQTLEPPPQLGLSPEIALPRPN